VKRDLSEVIASGLAPGAAALSLIRKGEMAVKICRRK
jgi:hypothetical protein